ncbi:lysophospholipid acyltransferase family protein [Sphingobacterium thermophilum]|uniref:Lysophospholipid acyltransferase family protein n=1 Tax=Sphingobacterium thermophilum TaxID=768534 RepID=A0ABP8QXF7_9SPHI
MSKSILKIVFWTLSKLPFSVLYLLSDVLYVLIYYIIGYRKKVVFKNLRNSFPEKSEEEILHIAKKFYRYFPDLIVECIKMANLSAEEVLKRMELINEEEVHRHLNAGKAIIGVTAHYSNWEWGIFRLSLLTEHPKLIIYKPLNNKAFDEVYNDIRTRFGATMVPMKQILRHIVRLRNTPHISMFVADQTPLYQDSDYFMPFLNQEALVYTGTERIAKMTNFPVVYCHIGRKEKRGYYYCKFTTLVEDPSQYGEHEITQIHNQFTEKMIRENPPYWLWTHNRWKRQRRNKS